jgi:soluble lytic murein transglycosylase
MRGLSRAVSNRTASTFDTSCDGLVTTSCENVDQHAIHCSCPRILHDAIAQVPGSSHEFVVRKVTRAFDMQWTVRVRLVMLALAVACSRPDAAPAQSDNTLAPFAGSREPAVTAAVVALASGRPWRATEILDSAYTSRAPRSPDVVLLSATAAAAWGGWSRVDRDLATAPWIDSLFEGRARELLARSALARGADSAARVHAERALRAAKTDRERGVREVLLARALDRQALGDSAAASYRRAAAHLPEISDWLELRAAGATADASRRQRDYARLSTPVARARVGPSEAQALERWRDFSGAARAYANMGEKAQSLRLQLLADTTAATRTRTRREAFALLAGNPSSTDARVAITLADSSLGPLSSAEQLTVARAANRAGLLARAASGFGSLDRSLGAPDRYAYGVLLSRLGRDAEAAAQLARVPATAAVGPSAAYQRARALLRAGKGSTARTALRRVTQDFPRDTAVAAPALFLLADLATDDGRDADARSGFLEIARRFPTSVLAPSALFHAAIIAYAGGSFEAAARDFDALVQRYPRSVDASAARYWSGRARDRMGDRTRAAGQWRDVMGTDPLSYYALKSALRLGVSPWRPAPGPDSLAPQPELARATARAALLEQLGMNTEESFEYDAMVSAAGRSPDSMLAAADALHQRGELSRAMGLARRALAASATRDTRLFHLLYPLAFADVIRTEAKARQIDPALVAALIHQESSFNPHATSRAGAMGLMQVLPSVGAAISKSRGMVGFDRVLLYQPDVNVPLGMAHLDAMVRQYPRIEYALAAYNAGGSPVRRWRQKRGTEDPELFVERIPYDETRDYVRILLRNQATYRVLYSW